MKKNNFNKKQQELTGAEILLKSLEDSGVRLITGYTGGTVMPILDLLYKYPKIKFITTRSEQGAGFISQGYTRASGKIAPVIATSGPGVTNTITPVADANMDSVPMFVISGQVAQDVIGTDAFQETDVLGLMYPITKYAVLPDSTDEIAKIVGQLLFIAYNGRPGPVSIDIPKNLLFEKSKKITIPKTLGLNGVWKTPKVDKNNFNVISAVKEIKKARKPVVLLGHGVILANAEKEILEFIEKTKIPVASTMHGLSAIPSSSPQFLGMMGMHGELQANVAIEDADLLIALGMRFDDRVTGKLSEYAKNAKVIHIETDPSEIDKNVKVDVQINADLKNALQVINELIENEQFEIDKAFLKKIEKNKKLSKKYYEHIFKKGVGKSGKLLMTRIVHELSEFTEGKDNIVTDVGQHQMQTAKFYNFQKFNSFFSSGGLGTMGFGLPAGIGVKLARPQEEVWVVVGDGGIQMNIQEFGTILQEQLKVNVLIFNNSFLGMVRQWQDLFFEKKYAETNMISPDFKMIAKAYGLKYKKVEKVEDIKKALNWSKKQKESTIVEFICDEQEIVYPMVPPGFQLKDMIENHKDAKKKLKIKD